jgi:hypothetical protein
LGGPSFGGIGGMQQKLAVFAPRGAEIQPDLDAAGLRMTYG